MREICQSSGDGEVSSEDGKKSPFVCIGICIYVCLYILCVFIFLCVFWRVSGKEEKIYVFLRKRKNICG